MQTELQIDDEMDVKVELMMKLESFFSLKKKQRAFNSLKIKSPLNNLQSKRKVSVLMNNKILSRKESLPPNSSLLPFKMRSELAERVMLYFFFIFAFILLSPITFKQK